MSIGKRLIDLVRSNIGHVIDRASDSISGKGSVGIEELSDDELEAELRRRRERRNAAERGAAAGDGYAAEDWDEVEATIRGDAGRYRSTRRQPTGTQPRVNARGNRARRPAGAAGSGNGAAGRDPRLAQYYAQLECPYGSDINAVRKSYRALMRKYHPDVHSGNPDKQRVATELSQRLTTAYNELRRALS